MKDRFTNWDGEFYREGYKSLEILYVIEKNGFDNEKLEIKLFLDDSSKNLFNSQGAIQLSLMTIKTKIKPTPSRRRFVH